MLELYITLFIPNLEDKRFLYSEHSFLVITKTICKQLSNFGRMKMQQDGVNTTHADNIVNWNFSTSGYAVTEGVLDLTTLGGSDSTKFSDIFGVDATSAQKKSRRKSIINLVNSNSTSTFDMFKVSRAQLNVDSVSKTNLMVVKPGLSTATDFTSMPDSDTAYYCALDENGDSFKFKTSAINTLVMVRDDYGAEERFIFSSGNLSTLAVSNGGTSTLTSENTGGLS